MVLLRKLCDPPLKLTRSLFPLTLGGMDFSPLILIFFLNFLGQFLMMTLNHLGRNLPVEGIWPIFLLCLLGVVISLIWFLWFLAVVRLIMSLVDPSPYNPLAMLVYGLTEPLLAPLRGWFGRGPGGLDLRALIVALGLFLINYYVLFKLKSLAIAWYVTASPAGALF
jgi:YggT family protein